MVKYTADKEVIRFSMPQDLWSAYKKRVKEFGFKSKTEVTSHLIDCFRRRKNGLPVSKTAEKIFSYIPENCQYVPRKAPRTPPRMFWLDKENAAWVYSLYSGRVSILLNGLIEAFLAADVSTIKSFRQETHAVYVCRPPETRLICIHVTCDQYDRLREVSSNAGLKISQLFRLVLNVFDGDEESCRVPASVSSVFTKVMRIKGFTLERFAREACVGMVVSDDRQWDIIEAMIKRYGIPGKKELLRRFALFLLCSQELSLSALPKKPMEYGEMSSCWNDAFDENEVYWNTQASKKDFVNSLY